MRGRQHLHGHQYAALENGQTLVKCTYMGYTGAAGYPLEQVFIVGVKTWNVEFRYISDSHVPVCGLPLLGTKVLGQKVDNM